MALQYVDSTGVYTIPGAYPSITVAPTNSGLATTGVLVLVGEADSGAAYSAETDLASNYFGPDQVSDVVAKYKSGNLVEAFRAAASAVIDPDIGGSFTRAIIVKTNTPFKATGILGKINSGGTYATIQDKAGGKNGNLLYFNVTAPTSEVLPTTGSFTYAAPSAATGTVLEFRVNGSTVTSSSPFVITQFMSPDVFVAGVAALAVTSPAYAIDATGGVERTSIIGVGATITIAPTTGNEVTMNSGASTWGASVLVGDTVQVKAGTFTTTRLGCYVVTAINAGRTNLTCTKLSDGVTGPNGTVTPATSEGVVYPSATFKIYSPVTIGLDAVSANTNLIDGQGKAIEIADASTPAGAAAYCFYSLGSSSRAPWVSTAALPAVLTSSAEASVSLNVYRSLDSVQESISSGGEVALKLGYKGTTGQVVVGATTLVFTCTGGSGLGFTATKSDFPTIGDLASFISAQTGWTASAGTGQLASLSPSAIDQGTYACGSTNGAQICRVKDDAYRFRVAVANSAVVELGSTPTGGQPTVTAVGLNTFLAGGAKGATLQGNVTGAIDACEKVRANFIIPLFSRDAGSANLSGTDIYDGLTDAGSTYTIDGINSYVKSHVNKMSTIKAKRNRQAFVSKRGTAAVAYQAAGDLASYRCVMTFLDFKESTPSGIVQFQPWMGAVLAAATQAGAFYKSIVRKAVNSTGVVQAAGDWTYNSDSDVENALKAGLLPVQKYDTGGLYWTSDQTTYGKDGSSVYNSIQMVYAADTVALTTALRMERAFVGQSVADVSAGLALSYLQGIMSDFLRLKLIAPSDDAPLGFRNAKIVIEGPAMRVSVEVKIAGSIYFIPIAFYVSEITQTAGV